MTKRTLLTIFVIFSLILPVTFTNVGIPKHNAIIKESKSKELNDNTNTINNMTQTSKKGQDSVAEQQTRTKTEANQKKIKPQIKYYIDKNYYIKPLDDNENKKVVLLTFDDSPQGLYTEDILNILDKYQAKAIFFVNGHYAVKNQKLLKEIYDKGHLIGNHTWWHKNLKKLNYLETEKEIVDVDDLIEKITGERPEYFRPPFGVSSTFEKKIIASEKMQGMNWSLGSLDWTYPNPEDADKVVEQVLNNVKPGSNILMHDKHVTSLALDKILSGLKSKGYSFVLPTEIKIDNIKSSQ